MSRFCHKCGAKLLPDARYCAKCGTSVWDEDSFEQQHQSNDSTKTVAPTSYVMGQGDTDVDQSYENNPTRNNSAKTLIIGLLVILAVLATSVFIIKPSYEHFQRESEKQQAEEVQAKFEEEHPVVAGILANCPSTQDVIISSAENKAYASVEFSISKYADKVAISQDLDCVRQQVGVPAHSKEAYLNGAQLWTELSGFGLDEYKQHGTDIQSMDFRNISDKAVARCAVSDSSFPKVYCEIGDSDDAQSSSVNNGDGTSGNEGESSIDDALGTESTTDGSSPADALGYEQYKDYNCAAGNSGRLIPCSEIYADMGTGMKYLPFGKENNPDPSNTYGYIPVDENGNGVIDADE
ncbi:hypothetical protein BMYO_0461 [Bifidobacterium myosotis]|uniref:Zinc-ribbon domain-containing protein n=1 Tax=Bifidobacterium myosotis TaxID=1630166 RepID=A0A261FPP3_9BIFI|nr:zinc ribbon domain-containing protein [Bifidobacterium myosotis]OZG61162.1 hypothetical protein BMYO_0461 [Bifidobacterium myosotis]